MSGEIAKEAKCQRCAVRLRIGKRDPNCNFIVKSESGVGYCPNCIATKFFKSPVMDGAIEAMAPGYTITDALKMEHVQTQFGNVLRAGKAQLPIDEIDWLEVVANWDLPFPPGEQGKPMTLWG